VSGWVILVMSIESDTVMNWPIWLLQISGTLCFFGLTGVALGGVWRSWTRWSGWFTRMWDTLLGLAALCILWVALAFHLISFGSQY
jgi:hypothetical protein